VAPRAAIRAPPTIKPTGLETAASPAAVRVVTVDAVTVVTGGAASDVAVEGGVVVDGAEVVVVGASVMEAVVVDAAVVAVALGAIGTAVVVVLVVVEGVVVVVLVVVGTAVEVGGVGGTVKRGAAADPVENDQPSRSPLTGLAAPVEEYIHAPPSSAVQ
jgi:hypothetical protein